MRRPLESKDGSQGPWPTRAKQHDNPRKSFRLPLGTAEHHHQTCASEIVRQTLDATSYRDLS
jgi:hypothetical protein